MKDPTNVSLLRNRNFTARFIISFGPKFSTEEFQSLQSLFYFKNGGIRIVNEIVKKLSSFPGRVFEENINILIYRSQLGDFDISTFKKFVFLIAKHGIEILDYTHFKLQTNLIKGEKIHLFFRTEIIPFVPKSYER